MNTIHALLVGIESYPNVPKLNRCVGDVGKMETYLSLHKPAQFELSLHKLINDEATKEGIVDAFVSHLGNSKAGDLAVLYYSGHGCQEVPDPEWERLDNRRKLESLVCYDFDFAGNGVLADKELRFLLPIISQRNTVDIITIFDCCNSGDMTRGDLQPKKVDKLAPLRNWKQFIFNEDLPYAQVQSATDLDEILPQADHIHMAACRDRELAYESTGGSVFTSVLLEVLEKAENRISYINLQSRIESFVRNKFTQTPQIQAKSKNKSVLNDPFLKGVSGGGRSRYNLTFSLEGRWKLDIGQIHGLKAGENAVQILSNAGQLVTMAKVSEVRLSSARVEPADSSLLHTSLAYYVEITGLSQTATSIYLQGDILGVNNLKNYLEKEAEELLKYNLIMTNDIALADYSVVAYWKRTSGLSSKGYCIWPPLLLDDAALPVFDEEKAYADPVKEFTEESAADVLEYFKKMAHWNYVREINNSTTSGMVGLLDLQLEKVSGEKYAASQMSSLEFKEGEEVKLKITNTSSQNLFVYCYLMTQQFMIESLIDDNAYEIKPGESVHAPRGSKLTVGPNRTPLPYEKAWIKLIYANERIQLSTFQQEGLKARGGTKGIVRSPTGSLEPVEPAWGTQTYEIRMNITPPVSLPDQSS